MSLYVYQHDERPTNSCRGLWSSMRYFDIKDIQINRKLPMCGTGLCVDKKLKLTFQFLFSLTALPRFCKSLQSTMMNYIMMMELCLYDSHNLSKGILACMMYGITMRCVLVNWANKEIEDFLKSMLTHLVSLSHWTHTIKGLDSCTFSLHSCKGRQLPAIYRALQGTVCGLWRMVGIPIP